MQTRTHRRRPCQEAPRSPSPKKRKRKPKKAAKDPALERGLPWAIPGHPWPHVYGATPAKPPRGPAGPMGRGLKPSHAATSPRTPLWEPGSLSDRAQSSAPRPEALAPAPGPESYGL